MLADDSHEMLNLMYFKKKIKRKFRIVSVAAIFGILKVNVNSINI